MPDDVPYRPTLDTQGMHDASASPVVLSRHVGVVRPREHQTMSGNNLYRMRLHPDAVADGPVLVALMPYAVTKLTDMALAEGHQMAQLKWHSMYAPVDIEHNWPAEYWVCARVLPLVEA